MSLRTLKFLVVVVVVVVVDDDDDDDDSDDGGNNNHININITVIVLRYCKLLQ
jgi:hypothetical protein